MKNKSIQIMVGTILGLLMLIAGSRYLVSGQETANESLKQAGANPSDGNRIVGTWQTLVTPRNCQTGVAVAPAFPGLLTFNRGGTLTGYAIAVNSVGGVWDRKSGWNEYSFAFISLRYNPAGAFIGTQKVRQTATLLSGNEFTTTGSFEVYDAAGAIIATGCSTSTGTRFE